MDSYRRVSSFFYAFPKTFSSETLRNVHRPLQEAVLRATSDTWPSEGTWSHLTEQSSLLPLHPSSQLLVPTSSALPLHPHDSPVPWSRTSSLPDSPTIRGPPGTWSSSCSGWQSRSCCSCQPSHRTWNLRAEAGLGGGSRALGPPPSPGVAASESSTPQEETRSAPSGWPAGLSRPVLSHLLR